MHLDEVILFSVFFGRGSIVDTMTDFKDERSEPQSGWAAEGKRIRPDVQVIFSSLLSSTLTKKDTKKHPPPHSSA